MQCEICERFPVTFDPENPDEYGYETPVWVDAPEGSLRAEEHWVCWECIDDLILARLERDKL